MIVFKGEDSTKETETEVVMKEAVIVTVTG